jgi:hypothetical protein
VNNRLISLGSKDIKYVLDFHRIVQHVQHVEIQRLHNVFNELDNQDIRILYLLGRITQDEIKVEVQKREKKREKERAVRRAMEVLVQAGTDILRRIMSETDINKKRLILEEIDALRVYVNELLAKIHERMKLSVQQYGSDWRTTWPFSAAIKKFEKAKALEKERIDKKTTEIRENIQKIKDAIHSLPDDEYEKDRRLADIVNRMEYQMTMVQGEAQLINIEAILAPVILELNLSPV